jgi:cytochrome c biogenesis factor
MLEVEDLLSTEQQKQTAIQAKQRFQSRKIRLEKIEVQKEQERKKRIAEFKASPQANELVRKAMEKAAAARSGRSDAERAMAALEKLQSKLATMKEELALAKASDEDTEELERRIKTWEQKIRDHQ